MKNIYDMEGRVQRVLRTIENEQNLSQRNKEFILQHKTECETRGLSIARVLFYLNHLLNLGRWIEKDFDAMSKEDIKAVVNRIQKMQYSDNSKGDYLIVIKAFYKWLDGGGEDYPEKVRWIRSRAKAKARLPEDILSKEDVQSLILAARSTRDRAFIATLYESGARVGELLTLRVKNVDFDEYGATLRVHGKTGGRRIRLVSSAPRLAELIDQLPSNQPSDFIWVSHGTRNHGGQLMYQSAHTLIRRISTRAGVQKRVNPH